MNILKRLIAIAPLWFQDELKRFFYRIQIKKESFISPEPEYEDLDKFTGDGDCVIDIGANIGHYTIKLASLVGEKGRVIAFEPIPTRLLIYQKIHFFVNIKILHLLMRLFLTK